MIDIIIIYCICFIFQVCFEVGLESEIDTNMCHQWIRTFLAPISLAIELGIIIFILLRTICKNLLSWIKAIPAAYKELF